MNTLTLIQTNLSNRCELNPSAFTAVQEANVVICDTHLHQVYVNQLIHRCTIIEIAHLRADAVSVRHRLDKLGAQTLKTVVLWNRNTVPADTLEFIQSSEGEAAFDAPKALHIDNRVQSLSGLPITADSPDEAAFLFISGQEWTVQLKRALYEQPAKSLVLVLSQFNTETVQLARELEDITRTADTPATLITPSCSRGRSSCAFEVLTPGHSIELALHEILIIGGSIDKTLFNAWSASRPLLGRRYMLTRTAEQQGTLREHLHRLGAQTVSFPVNELKPIFESRQEQMYASLAQYQWLIFTSVNAVQFFFKGLQLSNADMSHLLNTKVASIGPATTTAAQTYGLTVDLQPTEYTSEGLIEAFKALELETNRILLPRAQVARSLLPNHLRTMGAQVDVVSTYYKQPIDVNLKKWNRLNALALDGVLFCASSAAIDLENWIDPAEETIFKRSVPAFCIGPSTRQTVASMNYMQVFAAAKQTVDGLVECITRHR